jgi:hypothetical protein
MTPHGIDLRERPPQLQSSAPLRILRGEMKWMPKV